MYVHILFVWVVIVVFFTFWASSHRDKIARKYGSTKNHFYPFYLCLFQRLAAYLLTAFLQYTQFAGRKSLGCFVRHSHLHKFKVRELFFAAFQSIIKQQNSYFALFEKKTGSVRKQFLHENKCFACSVLNVFECAHKHQKNLSHEH